MQAALGLRLWAKQDVVQRQESCQGYWTLTWGMVPTMAMLWGALYNLKMLEMAIDSTVTVSGPAARTYTSFLDRQRTG